MRTRGTASAQLFSRLDTEQIFIAVRKFLDTAKNLQRNAEDRKREPAKEHEHPVQRSNKQFLHKPEGVAPFIEPDVREDHERADEQENVSNRPALAGEGRKPGAGIHEAAHADDDIHRVAHIELDDMAWCEDGMGRAAKVWHFRRCARNRWSALCCNRTISADPSPP